MILYFINSALPYEKNKVLDDVVIGLCRKNKTLSLYCNYIVVGFLVICGVQLRRRTNILHVMMQHIFTTSLSVTVMTQVMTDAGSSGLFSNNTYWIQKQMVQQWTHILLAVVENEGKYWLRKFDAFCHCKCRYSTDPCKISYCSVWTFRSRVPSGISYKLVVFDLQLILLISTFALFCANFTFEIWL